MQFKKTALAVSLAMALPFFLTACDDDEDNNNSSSTTTTTTSSTPKFFNRIATFPVCTQLDATCNTDTETAAEIVAASQDGNTLIYTNSPAKAVGFVDISTASAPKALGRLELSGEPTSVAVKDGYALVGVNTSADFINVAGQLDVIDIATRSLVTSIDLGGQPDSVAVSKDGAYAAVVIENERDEDLGNGEPPQLPAGGFVIVDLQGAPTAWTTRTVDMTGVASLFPADPEPEYVDINSQNVAVVTLQENNHIILVDLATGTITNHFSAGTVNLSQIDATEEDPALISLSESQSNVPREPDGVTWIDDSYFATADEGDMNGGSRGFTVFDTQGNIAFDAGNSLDHLTVRFGHYPDARSGNKGNEPENAEIGQYGSNNYLFVASERSSLIFVYNATDPKNPTLKQTLPAAVGPEGVLAIPSRDLLITASEKDDRGDKMRSSLNIYQYGGTNSSYPTLMSANGADGTPIAWSALSGLAASSADANTLYSIEDSAFQQSRIFKIDVSQSPALIVGTTNITDAKGVFAAYPVATLADTSVAADSDTRKDVFDQADLTAMINANNTVNLDPEGIAVASDGGFWVASEGSGTVGDANRPVNSADLIFKTDANGVIDEVIGLPAELNAVQLRFGFEGVSEYNGSVYVAFQRAWNSEANPRIGIYDRANKTWRFVFYPLDAVASQNGGWVGLSDLTSLGNGEFLVLERDNQGGPDAAIKRLYRINVSGVADNATVSKTLVKDLMPELAKTGGLTCEKIEGSAVMANGDVMIVNDNDGVDDNSGETQLINLGKILN